MYDMEAGQHRSHVLHGEHQLWHACVKLCTFAFMSAHFPCVRARITAVEGTSKGEKKKKQHLLPVALVERFAKPVC